MVMMDSGHGSSKARAGVFFLSLGFALTAMFENICVSTKVQQIKFTILKFSKGNAVAGGIDLAGLFPRYIDIRRVNPPPAVTPGQIANKLFQGALITFVACWVYYYLSPIPYIFFLTLLPAGRSTMAAHQPSGNIHHGAQFLRRVPRTSDRSYVLRLLHSPPQENQTQQSIPHGKDIILVLVWYQPSSHFPVVGGLDPDYWWFDRHCARKGECAASAVPALLYGILLGKRYYCLSLKFP